MRLNKLFFPLLLLIFCLTSALQAQNTRLSKDDEKIQKEAKKKERQVIEKMLTAYTNCSFEKNNNSPVADFVTADIDRIRKDKEENLIRETDEGEKTISRTDSYRVMFSFTDTPKDIFGRPYYFANVRPDRSKPSEYENDKKILIGYLEHTAKLTDTISVKKPVEKNYHGFSVFSVYRSALVGDNLGISVIFDDADKVITTIYFLSEPKDAKALSHFKNINEWMNLREKFLDSYTSCVSENLKNN